MRAGSGTTDNCSEKRELPSVISIRCPMVFLYALAVCSVLCSVPWAVGEIPLLPVQPEAQQAFQGQSDEPPSSPTEPAAELPAAVPVASVTWDWPSRQDQVQELRWPTAVADGLSWWLGLPISLPQAPLGKDPLETKGTVSLVVQPIARAAAPEAEAAWEVSYGAVSDGFDRIALHRAALGLENSGRAVLMEGYLDLNAMRRADPERSGWGEIAKLLKTWRLSNARDIMIHASASPRPYPLPMVVWLDVTWSSRSDPLDLVRGKTLTRPLGMVEAAEMSPEGVSWVLALDADVRTAIARALGSAIASRHEDAEFEQEALRWATRSRDRITRMQAVLDEQALVVGGNTGLGVRIPLRRQSAGRSVVSDIGALQSRLGPVAQSDEGAQAGGVILSPRTQLRWWVGEASQASGLSWLAVELHAAGSNEPQQRE